MVESVTEHFYASMGVNRLRGYLTTFGPGGTSGSRTMLRPLGP